MRKMLFIGVVTAGMAAGAHAADGDLVWAKAIGGTEHDYGKAIAVDGAGNVYTAGAFDGTVDFDPGPGTYELIGYHDFFVSKLDSAGNFVWAKRSSGVPGGRSVSAIAVDSAGNVYTTGFFSDWLDFDPGPEEFTLYSSGTSVDIFVSKLDSAGNFVWAKRMGDTGSDSGYGIALDAAGNVYTTGQFHGTVDFDPGPGIFELTSVGEHDIFVSKLDSAGNFVWAKRMGGTFSEDYGYGIALDATGNVYTTGGFDGMADFDPSPGTFELTSLGEHDIFVSKLDSMGNFVWAKRMGGTALDKSYGIAVDDAGSVYTTGSFEGTADFDPGPGNHELTTGLGTGLFVSKLSDTGDFIWAKALGGTIISFGYDIALDTAGNVYTAGSCPGTADFDPGPGTFLLNSPGAFVWKLDNAGDFVWAKALGATVHGYGIIVDYAGDNVYTTGGFDGTADFDPSPGTFELTSVGDSDIFISKLGPPAVLSILRMDASPTHERTVGFAVGFNTDVTGVDVYDFALDLTGSISGADIARVTGSGYEYTVIVDGIIGDGTLRLDLFDDDSVQDLGGEPLGGPGIGNGDFTTGEAYEILPALPLAPWPAAVALLVIGATTMRKKRS